MLSCIMKFNEWVFENVKLKLSRFIVLIVNDYSYFLILINKIINVYLIDLFMFIILIK